MLSDRIEEDFKNAFKAKDEIAKSALGNLKAALKDAEISKRDKLTDAEVLSVVAKKVKQHKDSIESFIAGGRNDLVEVETAQLQILQKFLPAQMSESELVEIVKNSITSLNATAADFGKVMKDVVSKVKGQADGSVISKLVKENLK